LKILDGKVVAESRRRLIAARVAEFKERRGRVPALAVVLVGDDPASQVYVAGKIKACEQVGIASLERKIPAATTAAELRALIETLNQDESVDGILLQLPLPKHLSGEEAVQWISPAKDADCLTAKNLGRLWSGDPLTIPCTPWGVMVILEHYGIKTDGMEAVVVGRSQIVGKPMAHLLVQANATVTICHSRTKNLKDHIRRAEIVVVAAGKPEFLGAGDFAPGAVVVDVGIHRKDLRDGKTRLCGDVRLKELEGTVRAGTPVPGGVGPMTITMLMENTLRLADARPL
jgi:methylenetetrahydrofolate dehydrogenase (NADP+)/methenyltetrahydrofolate cyclohydrolase